MPKAYSYIRMSRPEQLRGDSLRRQTEAAEAWAAARGVDIDDTLQDIGISAYRGKNRTVGALAAFLKLVEDGRVERGSYLIVESLDRLSREAVLDTLPRFIDLVRAGVVVVTLIDGQEYSDTRLKADWTPLILSLAVMARAHDESRTKAERVGQAWAKKREAAKPGAVLTSRVPAWLRVRNDLIEQIPERVEVVQRIFRETLDGCGRRTIVSRLNKSGVRPFLGGEGWQFSSVAKILANRAVIGEFQPYGRDADGVRRPKGDPVPGYYPAVVSEADFLRANLAIRSRRRAPGRRGEGVTNLFVGLVRCAACNASMMVENKGASHGRRSFICSNARRGAGCDNRRRWRLDTTETAILRRLWDIDLTAVLDPPRPAEAGEEADAIRAALEDAKARRERLLDLVEAGDERAVERARLLSAGIKDLTERLARSEGERRLADQMPSARSRLAAVRELSRLIETAQGQELVDLRTRLAQALRLAVEVVAFAPHRVSVRYAANRAGKEAIRRVPAPGRPLPPLEVTVLDDAPAKSLSEEEIADIEAEIAAQEADSREASKPLPTSTERIIARLARKAGVNRAS